MVLKLKSINFMNLKYIWDGELLFSYKYGNIFKK